MLHLQAGVHLEEVKALVGTHDELDGTGRLVVHRLRQGHGLLAHGLACGGVDEGAGRLFDHFLVPTLDRAFALVQVHGVAMRVAQDLDLDVAGLDDELLDEHAIIAKAVARLVHAGGETLMRFLVVMRHAQTLATTTGRSLDHHRVADLPGDFHRLVRAGDGFVVARDGIDARIHRQLLRLDLVAHLAHRVVLGADEDNAFLFQPARELRVLGQEAVTRVHRFSAGLLAGGDDLVHHQVGLFRGRRADAHAFVGEFHMQRALVRLRIHGNGGDAHLAGGLDDAAGDFPAVCNQYFLEHLIFPRARIRAGCCRACATGFPVPCP